MPLSMKKGKKGEGESPTELVEESSKKAEAEIAHESSLKRVREELEQESSKTQKLEEDKESEELKQCVMMTHPGIGTIKADVELEEDQEEDGDDGDTFNMWDVTFKEVERIRQFLTPNVPDEIDEAIQPLIQQPIHTTPPNNDYVAVATKSILDELLDEFKDEIVNVTMVNEEADPNPTRDIEELERLLAKDPQSHFTKIQGSNYKGMEFEVS
ncbi:hypothetical protein Tco_1134239 [Tanacetum coccineum]